MVTRHPSGRPVRPSSRSQRRDPVWQCPLEQPATPRLRDPKKAELAPAIGFHRFDSTYDLDRSWAKKR